MNSSVKVLVCLRFEAKVLKSLFEAASFLDGEARFTVSRDGVELRFLDAANVALFNASVNVSEFADIVAPEEPVEFNLKLLDFSTFFKRVPADAVVVFAERERSLAAEVCLPGVVREQFIPLYEFSLPKTNLPSFETSASAALPLATFALLFEIEAQSMRFRAAPASFAVDGMDRGDVTASSTVSASEDLVVEGSAVSKYGGEYCSKVVKVLQKFAAGDRVVVKFAKDYPARFVGESKSRRVEVVLAPRVDNE